MDAETRDAIKELTRYIKELDNTMSIEIKEVRKDISDIKSDLNVIKQFQKPSNECREHIQKEIDIIRNFVFKSFVFTCGAYIFTWIVYLIVK